MKISDWVHTCHNMNKITGFITRMTNERVMIHVTIPKNYGTILMHKKDVWLADDTIWMDDIPCMLDLSLQIHDREWFDKWTHELSLWKSAQEVSKGTEE